MFKFTKFFFINHRGRVFSTQTIINHSCYKFYLDNRIEHLFDLGEDTYSETNFNLKDQDKLQEKTN
jgi:hypothetical protein